MGEFRKAPDGQPTENIELMLRTAKAKVEYWLRSLEEDRRNLRRSEGMVESWADDVTLLEWQLGQRKASEVNGL